MIIDKREDKGIDGQILNAKAYILKQILGEDYFIKKRIININNQIIKLIKNKIEKAEK